MTNEDQLRIIAKLARRSIEPGLATNASGAVVSAGSCLYASFVAVMLINRFGRGQATVRGGGHAEAGARDVNGFWHGHYWVDVALPEGDGFTVDITADQFGYEPVVVLPLDAARHRYRPGPQCEVDAAVEILAQEIDALR